MVAALGPPARIAGVYWRADVQAGGSLGGVHSNWNIIYLFVFRQDPNGPTGSISWGGISRPSLTDINNKRETGRRLMLTVGGANSPIAFTTRTVSQNFVNSVVSTNTAWGGTLSNPVFDGVDFNTFEKGTAKSTTEYIWMSTELRRLFGSQFIIACPPAPWASEDRTFCQEWFNAADPNGRLTYAAPQYYDGTTLSQYSTINGTATNSVENWVNSVAGGDASKIVVGYGLESNNTETSADYSTSQTINDSWNNLKSRFPSLRGAFLWSNALDAQNNHVVATTLVPTINPDYVTGETSPTVYAVLDNLNLPPVADTAPPPPPAGNDPVSALSDSFSGASLDPTKWLMQGVGSKAKVTNRRLEVPLQGEDQWTGIRSANAHDLTDSSIFTTVNVSDVEPNYEASFIVRSTSVAGSEVRFTYRNGVLTAYNYVGWADSAPTSVIYSAANHARWRIIHSSTSNTVEWQVAPRNSNSWTTIRTAATPAWDITSVYVLMEGALNADVTTIPIVSVTASGDDGNPATNAVDGSLATWWNFNGTDGSAWLQADIGTTQVVGSVDLAFYRGDARKQRFWLEASTDATSWTRVVYGQSSGLTLDHQRFHFPERQARYLRYVGLGNDENIANSVTELRVWGGDATTAAPVATTVSATGATASIAVTWSPGFGPMPTLYTLERGTSDSGPWTTLLSETTATSYTDNNVVTGTSYWYRVTPSNADGDGPATVTASAAATSNVLYEMPLATWGDGAQITEARLDASGLITPWGMRHSERSLVMDDPFEASGMKVVRLRHRQQVSSTTLENEITGFSVVLPGRPTVNANPTINFEWDLAFGMGASNLGFPFWLPGGKLPGPFFSPPNTALRSCEPYTGTTGANMRKMWRMPNHNDNERTARRRQLMTYAYWWGKQATCGDNYSFDIPENHLQEEVWYRIRTEFYAGTPGNFNGYVREYLDDVLVNEITGLRTRSDNTTFEWGFTFHPYFGGADPSWGDTRQENDFYFRRIRVWFP